MGVGTLVGIVVELERPVCMYKGVSMMYVCVRLYSV